MEWAPSASSTFLVNIQVEALDRNRLLSDITMVLSDAHVNILSANLSTRPRPGRQDPASPSRWPRPNTSTRVLKGGALPSRGCVFDAYRVTS